MRTVSTTIEQLELEVQSSATSAVAQLDALASSLGKVKSATKGGVGLTAVARQLTTLNTALNSISSTNADNLNKMAQGLQALSSCGNLKLSSSVANQISNLGTAVRSLNGTDFPRSDGLRTRLLRFPQSASRTSTALSLSYSDCRKRYRVLTVWTSAGWERRFLNWYLLFPHFLRWVRTTLPRL